MLYKLGTFVTFALQIKERKLYTSEKNWLSSNSKQQNHLSQVYVMPESTLLTVTEEQIEIQRQGINSLPYVIDSHKDSFRTQL